MRVGYASNGEKYELLGQSRGQAAWATGYLSVSRRPDWSIAPPGLEDDCMTRRVRSMFFSLLAALVLPAGVSCAEPVALQLKPVAMPAITDKGYQGRTTFTPYIEVENEKAAQRLCERLPRFMDAVLVALEEKPVRLADVALDIASRQSELRALADTSVGKGIFKAFYLLRGSKDRAEGTEAYFIDGSTRECTPIKALPWTVEAPVSAAEGIPAPAAEGRTPALSEPASDTPAAAPSPLTKAELDRAEAELLADLPTEPRPFPGAPAGAKRGVSADFVVVALVILGLGGVMMVLGSYIGYQVAKIRRDRRRRERRKARKDRRAGVERRQGNDGPPASGERRQGEDRRAGEDRRKSEDRRAAKDRRQESEPEN